MGTTKTTLVAGLIAAASLLVACGGDDAATDSDSDPTTAMSTEAPAQEDESVTTNAPATPADVTDGAASISVTVGVDDFETSGGTRVVSVPAGTVVTISLTNPDAADEFHLHGYDVEAAAEKGETVSLEVTADETGRFDLESHETEATLLVLVVE